MNETQIFFSITFFIIGLAIGTFHSAKQFKELEKALTFWRDSFKQNLDKLDKVQSAIKRLESEVQNTRMNNEPAEAEGYDPGYDWREHNRGKMAAVHLLEKIMDE